MWVKYLGVKLNPNMDCNQCVIKYWTNMDKSWVNVGFQNRLSSHHLASKKSKSLSIFRNVFGFGIDLEARFYEAL